tara:strand:- start:248 stop:385 length:138 start_codon:yes stop_codon:yes gene_type:complete
MKITGRDVKFFFLGIFTLFIIDTVMNWEEVKENFNKGFNESFEKR